MMMMHRLYHHLSLFSLIALQWCCENSVVVVNGAFVPQARSSVSTLVALERTANPTAKHSSRTFVPFASHSTNPETVGVPITHRPSRKRFSLSSSSAAAGTTDADHLPPVPTEWRGQVLSTLKAVIDPDLNRDIVTLGFVKNLSLNDVTRTVSFDVELTTPACPVKDQFAEQCRDLVMNLPWTKEVDVTMTAQPPTDSASAAGGAMIGLSQVGAIIAVSSCKGGVGKSTTAVNLAYALQNLGATVGIFDADLYGPSLPTMVTPDDDIVRFVGRQIAPLQRNGVRLMSFGYVNEGSAVMRGPMVAQLLDQILGLTHWGQLDYLVLDMPPGTGDVQLTLCQRLNITAAVVVTTPQELSFADVVRGIEMFDTVNVPCVAVVENMAYYEVDSTHSSTENEQELDWHMLREAFVTKLKEDGTLPNGDGQQSVEQMANELVRIVKSQQQKKKGLSKGANGSTEGKKEQVRIFGTGHKRRLSEQYGIEHTYSVPLLNQIAANGDSGTPFILEHPDSAQAKIYHDLAASVVSEIAKTKFAKSRRPSIVYNEEQHLLEVDEENELSPAELRRECRCAACVEELSGRQLLRKSDVPDSVKPVTMAPYGNYALSVDWSDGHRSLYPYRQIRSLLRGGVKDEAKKEEVRV